MRTYEEFKTFYRNELLDEIRFLETKRKTNILRSILVLAVTGVLFLIIYFLLPTGIKGTLFFWKVLLFTFLFVVGLCLQIVWKGFHLRFKDKIIRKVLHFINPTFQYFPNRDIGEYAFDQSCLFLQRYDKFSGEDLICGKVGKTAIKCSEIDVRQQGDKSDHTIFRGLFMVADFNKHFSGRTVVLPDKAEKYLGRFGRKFQEINPTRDQLIHLEDPEFEEQFVIYGEDQIESRYLLTPALMKRILKFNKTAESYIYLSFYRSKLYVAVPLSRNLFEPKKGESIDYIAAYTYFKDFHFILSLVEELNLNTRIWTKE